MRRDKSIAVPFDSLHATSMPLNLHDQTKRTYIIYTILRDLFTPSTDLEDLCRQHELDLRTILTIKNTRYIHNLFQLQSPLNISPKT